MELGPIRTALFVPGNRLERVDKAVNTKADVVIIDLEDSVPLSQKEEVRPGVKQKVLEHKDRKVMVRINSLDSGFMEGDLQEVAVRELACIMIPKIEEAAQIREINKLLIETEKQKGIRPGALSIFPLIESAKGVQNIYSIVSEKTDPPRITTVAFGAADYTLDLGTEITREGTELLYARSRIPVACRAAGLEPPIDTPFMIDLKDVELLKVDAKRAKQFGFQGKLCIHPNQIEPCNAIFSPREDEIIHAKKIIEAFEEAEAKGLGAIQLEGKFIDYPVVERSRRILRLAAAIKNE